MTTALRMSANALLGRQSFRLTTLRENSATTSTRAAVFGCGGLDPCNDGVVNYRVQQRRTMVMVTKQKAGESPPPPPATITSTIVKNSLLDNPTDVSNDDNGAALSITESCWQRIRKLKQTKQNESLFLRVFVDAGGCSGFQYQFELDSELQDDDVVFAADSNNNSNNNDNAATVVVDPQSLDLIRGSTIDYVQEMIKSSFEVRSNPQSESACGCGSSFAVKNFSSNPAIH